MEIDKWISSCKVRAFPWIDGEQIYFNVRYFAPGQSIHRPPVFDKTVYIIDNSEGRRLVYEFTHTLVEFISRMNIEENTKVVIKV